MLNLCIRLQENVCLYITCKKKKRKGESIWSYTYLNCMSEYYIVAQNSNLCAV